MNPVLGRRFWVGIMLSALFLTLSFRAVDWQQTFVVVREANWLLVALAVGTVLLTSVAKAVRWRLLFYPHHRTLRFTKLVSSLLIGQMINIVMPARLGEVARVYLVGVNSPVSRVQILGTIAVAKLVDLMMVPIILVVLLGIMPLPDWVQQPGVQATLLAGGAAGLLMSGALLRRHVVGWVIKGADRLSGHWSHRIARQIEMGLSSLEALRYPIVVVSLVLGSAGIWVLAALTNYLVFLALDLSLSFGAALFLLVVLQLGVAVPSAPGKLGVFHYLCVLGLSVFGVARAPAVGYALLLYAVVFLPLSIAGALALWGEGLSLRRVQTVVLEAEP